MSAFHFLRPWWFLTLLPAALTALLLLSRHGGRSAWRQVCDPDLLKHLWLQPPGAVSRLPVLLLGFGWVLATVALAGPTWEKAPQPLYHARTARVLVLDMSPSMNVRDVAPSRLARARFKITDILKRTREGVTGLVVFGGEPHLVTPLTRDTATIFNLMQSLSTDLMPVRGSSAAPALAMAGDLLKNAGAKDGQIILLTDGVSDMAASLSEARALRREGNTVSVLGVGTKMGAPIPGADGGHRAAMARLRSDALAELAKAGNGTYSPITADDSDLARLLSTNPRLDTAERDDTSNGVDQWVEFGPWLLPLMLMVAALGFRRGWLIGLVLTMLLPGALASPAYALEWSDLWARKDQRAARALEHGRPAEAAGQFQDPAWRGTAHYRAGDFKKAAKAFAKAKGPDAAYNRGNALAKAGQLKEAAEAYRKALKAKPGHEDAQANLKLVEKLLELQQNRQIHQSQNGSENQRYPGGQNRPQDSSNDRQADQQGQDRSKQQTRQDKDGSGQDNRQQADQTPDNADKQPQDKSGDNRASGKHSQKEEDDAEAARRDVAPAAEEPDDERQDRDPKDIQAQQPPPSQGEPADDTSQDANGLETEQWLRQVPDDPGELLRRKFMLDHLRRQQEAHPK